MRRLRNRASLYIISALMERILAFARENGVEQVNLEVRSDNKRAIALYEKFGFVPMEHEMELPE
mgnify:CR=1 FL=1